MSQRFRLVAARCALVVVLLGPTVASVAHAQDVPPPPAVAADPDSVSADSAAAALTDLLQRLRDQQAEEDDSLQMTGDGWIVVVSEEYGYRIEFPAPPITQSTAPNVELKLYEPSEDDGYVALAVRVDPDLAESFTQAQVIDNAVQRTVSALDGTLVRDEKTIIQGYPARVVVIQSTSGQRIGY
ncbi:MAG: hypothetical protein AAGN64_17285, partial [Bacteroidota bacterium]